MKIVLKDYKEDEDPKMFLSKKTGRGLLKPDWKETTKEIMCAYKLVTVEFKWFGLQTSVEKLLHNVNFIEYLKLKIVNNSFVLCPDREAPFYKVSSAIILLDRSMVWSYHGGHTASREPNYSGIK